LLPYREYGVTDNERFFYRSLAASFNLKDLLYEAYILVKHCRFAYSDIQDMSKAERALFLEFFTNELEEEKRASKQHTSRR
jgi:hypothetical protein